MRRAGRKIAVALVAALLMGGAAGTYWALGYPERPRTGDGRLVEVSVAPGESFAQVAGRLHDRGVIDHPRLFRIYAHRRGVANQIRSGTYTLHDDMRPREVVDVLIEGAPDETIAVTIPEGYHMLEAFELIDERGIASRAELESLAFDESFLRDQGIQGPSAEGFLFPDTYDFRAPTPPQDVLRRMIIRHREVWNDVREAHAASYQRLREELDWTEREFIVMASIVEKEARKADESPRIAQVFINRLTSSRFRPRLLQTDPTIRYGCMVPLGGEPAGCRGWEPTDRLRRAQLDDADNPYNTYQHEGLPPSPIALPGRTALEATVSPDGSDYLYFVSRNDGTHVFSRTYAEHARAVDRYQR